MKTRRRLGKKFCVFVHLVSRTWHLASASGLSWFLVVSVLACMQCGSFEVYDMIYGQDLVTSDEFVRYEMFCNLCCKNLTCFNPKAETGRSDLTCVIITVR